MTTSSGLAPLGNFPVATGSPPIVVQNMPGAGSLKAANYLYNVAPKDGSTFGSFSRAWRRSDVPGVPIGDRDRKEISGGASYALTKAVHVFGSTGRTIATLEENGAGTTIAGGVSFFVMSTPR